MPSCSQAAILDFTYSCDAGFSPTRTAASPGLMPAALRSRISLERSAKTRSRIFVPSRIRAVILDYSPETLFLRGRRRISHAHAGVSQPLFHDIVAHEAGLLHHHFAAGHNGEVWNAADLKPRGELLVGFGVDFEYDGFAGHARGGLGDFGGGHAARSAPGGPEVDEDGDAGVLDDLVERRLVDRDWLSERRQIGLAGAALAGDG